MATNERQLAGVLGFFEDDHSLLEAVRKTRDANYKSFDAFTPYPVHGMDEAQGLKRSFLPYITFVFGLTGFLIAFGLQYWTSAVDWPINVGGKPFNSWPAFVPVLFELTVLLAGISTAVGMILINRLPNTTKRSFDPSLTCDRFALLIEAPASSGHGHEEEDSGHKKFDESEAQSFLQQLGARDVRKVYEEGWF